MVGLDFEFKAYVFAQLSFEDWEMLSYASGIQIYAIDIEDIFDSMLDYIEVFETNFGF